jgi:hypothetical protein
MVRYLPEEKPKIPPMGVSHTDIPPQGVSTSNMRQVRDISLSNRWTPSGEESSIWMGQTETQKKQERGQEKQKLGAFSNQEMQARPSREKTQHKPRRGQGQRVVPLLIWQEIRKGPGTYKEALTSIKISSRNLFLKIS